MVEEGNKLTRTFFFSQFLSAIQNILKKLIKKENQSFYLKKY